MNVHIVPSGKDDAILYYAKTIRVGKKTTSKNVERIGRLSELRKLYDDPVAHFRAEAKRKTEEGKTEEAFVVQPNVLIDPAKKRRIRMGYIFPQSVYYAIGIDGVMRRIRNESEIGYDFNRIMRDLVIGRILDPMSKCSTYEAAKGFPEPPDYDLHQVYRALSLAAENSDLIQEKVFRGMRKYADVDTSVTYYDCTNFFFETEEEDGFRCYGKSKENRPNPIVEMGLFLDRNGLPVSMCINPGNTSEQKTMIPLEEKMKKQYGIRKFIVCADCGLSGKRNLRYNSTDDHGFVVTKSLKKTAEDVRSRLMAENGWRRFGGDRDTTYTLTQIRENTESDGQIFYHDEKFLDKTGFRERIITTFSTKLMRYQRSIREGQIQRAIELVKDGRMRKGVNQNDVRRFITEQAVTENGEAADTKTYAIDTERFDEESRYDGFYAVTTDLDDDPEEIVRVNRGRWEIEESFRIMKTDFEARPVFLSREDRIRAHFLICYLALTVFRVMEQKMRKAGENFTAEEIIKSLRGYDAADMGSFYAGMMEGPAVTALEKTFGLVGRYSAMSKARFRKIVSDSKGRD